jgi:hypothetical protein
MSQRQEVKHILGARGGTSYFPRPMFKFTIGAHHAPFYNADFAERKIGRAAFLVGYIYKANREFSLSSLSNSLVFLLWVLVGLVVDAVVAVGRLSAAAALSAKNRSNSLLVNDSTASKPTGGGC